MKFKDLKVGDVLKFVGLFSPDLKLYYLVTNVYQYDKKYELIDQIVTCKCFDCYSFSEGKIYTNQMSLHNYSKSKISQMFE